MSDEKGLTIVQEGPIRKFADANLAASVDKVLATIPEDKHAVVLAVADKDGAQGVAAVRLGAGWSLMGVLDKRWKGDFKAQAAIKWVG